MPGNELPNGSPGQGCPAVGREQRPLSRWWELGEPGREEPDGVLLQRDHALLAALPDAFELAVWSELKVTDAQVDEFADAESGLDAQVQQEPVAATEPGPGVRGSDERLCFGAVRNDTSVVLVLSLIHI